MSQFLDHAFIEVSSGDGGNGAIAWRRDKYEPMGGPAGGTGGRGGHAYIEASKDLNTLIDFRFQAKFVATFGQRGASSSKSGKAGEDLTIKVPAGTLIKDRKTGQIIADLTKPGMRVLVAEGGKGGRGNAAFATPTRRAPYFCEPGQPGIKRQLELELKLLADIGLAGAPNAGKSTLLAALTDAKPKIAAYPFSTLEPNLGVIWKSNGDGCVLADIPGLLEGASDGVGLGHQFLRHIERTRMLLHLVDITIPDLEEQIEIINRELTLFNPALAKKEQLLVLNKSDLLDPEEVEAIKRKLSTLYKGREIFAISAAGRIGLTPLTQAIEAKLNQFALKETPPVDELIPDEAAYDHGDNSYFVSRQKDVFHVEGDRIARLAGVTDLKSPESIHHFNQLLRSMGVFDQLIKEKIKAGDTVQIGPLSFTFGEDLF